MVLQEQLAQFIYKIIKLFFIFLIKITIMLLDQNKKDVIYIENYIEIYSRIFRNPRSGYRHRYDL